MHQWSGKRHIFFDNGRIDDVSLIDISPESFLNKYAKKSGNGKLVTLYKD